MSESPTTGGRQVTVTRVFDAPRELVWKAWTDPEHFTHWFGAGPYTTPLSTISMDVRPGGGWRASQVSSEDGSEIPFAGVYREVAEPERLVFTFDFSEGEEGSNVEVVTVTLEDLGGGKTKMVVNQAGHLPEEEYEQLKEGYVEFFDRLEKHLERAGT